MFAQLGQIEAMLRDVVATFDERPVDGNEAARLVEICTTIERLAIAARTFAARRVAATPVWQRDGHRTPAHWLASKTGVSVGQGLAALEAAEHIEVLPDVKAAFSEGRLSEPQAREVAAAAAADPTAAAALLDTATRCALPGLRQECRRVRAAAEPDQAARYRRLHEGRHLRHWTESDGAVRLSARLAPDTGGAVIATIRAYADSLRARARRRGEREPYEAYAADALVELSRTGAGAHRPPATVHLFVDHAALTRGEADEGEQCEIAGIGPVPVATARAMLTDAILNVLVTDGVDIKTVAHVGRTLSAPVRRTLAARDPVCVVPTCDEDHDLEIDHWRFDCAWGLPACVDDLARLCRWHHYLRTYCGYQLTGGPGRWTWLTPDDAEGVRDARPPPAA